MRITSAMLYNQLARGLKDNLSELTEKNNWLATGKKISKPSMMSWEPLRPWIISFPSAEMTSTKRNMIQANNFLEFQDKIMSQVSDTLGSLKKLIYSRGRFLRDSGRSGLLCRTSRKSEGLSSGPLQQ